MPEEPAGPPPPEKPTEKMTPVTLIDGPVPESQLGKNKKKLLWIFLPIIFLALVPLAFIIWSNFSSGPKSNNSSNTTQANDSSSSKQQSVNTVQGLALDAKKNYGNKYADGIVPVGDSHYVSNAAKKGYIYVCNANFVPAGQAGAQTRGPWFTNNNTEYDINKKSHIAGSVSWTSKMTNVVSGATRTVSTNDLPIHKTGVFPVSSTDPAHKYDSNPNSIKEQTLTYALNANPSYGTPNCVGGEVGIMLTGVALFDGFDAGGRDAGAWEVQDGCDGHPQDKGEYHYHSLSGCITDIGVGTVLGFALDGYPITGPKVGDNNFLTTDDLDECHGIVSEVTLDNKRVTTYHYVMTQDFPYSVSCFRSKAIQAPGLKEGSGQPGGTSNSQQQQPKPPGGTMTPPPGSPPY